mmetsp:Transcript_36466/g.92168  ORF Transcript_36466/g.92168 Transcript_36466/m.92168 type:complete len:242 (-) Transcript_36466:610-1335(-)
MERELGGLIAPPPFGCAGLLAPPARACTGADGLSHGCRWDPAEAAEAWAQLSSGAPLRLRTDDAGVLWAYMAEAVEVKSSCPFVLQQRRGGGGRWAAACRGPREDVPPAYIPQLHLEMLATGVQSCLLLCHSASEGINVFRVWRDDTYVDSMMEVLRLSCGPGEEPPSLPGQPAYQALLRRTLSIARGARLLRRLPSPGACAAERLAGLLRDGLPGEERLRLAAVDSAPLLPRHGDTAKAT